MTRKDMGLNDDVPHMAADDDFNTVIILSQIRWLVNTEFASVPIDIIVPCAYNIAIILLLL